MEAKATKYRRAPRTESKTKTPRKEKDENKRGKSLIKS
jgi:hypothetical protein